MKLKLFFLLSLVFSLNMHSQVIEENDTTFIKDYSLLKSIKGKWKNVHSCIDNIEVDCENFEKSLKKQLELKKSDTLGLRTQFNIICNNMKRHIITITDSLMISRNDTTTLYLDNQLKKDIIYTKGIQNEYKIKVIKIDKDYFRLHSTDNLWLELKKIED